jgi:c-di-GMP-binding flagellar brake protein YcgR
MLEADMLAEKRGFPRISVKIAVKYRVIEDEVEIKSVFERRKKEQNTETIDISLGGLYIVAVQALTVKSILRLDISLPGTKGTLTAFAEVMWSNETGGGVRFLTMKEEDSASLKAYLDSISS